MWYRGGTGIITIQSIKLDDRSRKSIRNNFLAVQKPAAHLANVEIQLVVVLLAARSLGVEDNSPKTNATPSTT
jgi:hypothetical protein